MNKLTITLIVVTGTLVMSIAAAWADWRDDLQNEIWAAHRCEVARLSFVVERSLRGGQHLVATVVDCTDGRRFEALRPEVGVPFWILQCDVPGKRKCPK